MARPTAQRVVSEKGHQGPTKEFLQLATSIARREGWSEYEAFTKWLDAATCALRNPILKRTGQQVRWDANEDRYMKIVKSCRHKQETMGDMSSMMAVITEALEAAPVDFLGPIFMELAASSGMGQFFTPHTVSKLIAGVSLHEANSLLCDVYIKEGRDYLTLHEPACGVGGMVLASNTILREQQINVATQAHWVCVDIDWRAVCGTFIQLTLTGSSAIVVHGNTITLDEWDQLPTLTAVLHPKRVYTPSVQLIASFRKSLTMEEA